MSGLEGPAQWYRVVTAHAAERTREVGIRMAVGAPKRVVLRAVLLEGAMMTLIGMIGGAALTALFSAWLESILYGVSRHDPATITVLWHNVSYLYISN